ncbi:copper resistance protein B [Marinicauda algicola]|uniref:Copper resistance protein B n=1 Tax=Marinicauda algicola TaxID=2029849 RepID=A0A4S2GZF1_9PROT|nr:copper resistance protein B [Marinicauda algicola]TGY88202.1 copper resistance protein B [Marinicauda algicola]
MRALLTTTVLCAALGAPAIAQDGQWSAADEYYDPAEMDEARRQLQHEGGGTRYLFFQADRLEYQSNDGAPLLVWDAQGWYGGDLNRIWVKTEGEHSLEEDSIEGFEIEALYSRAITPYFDLQAGLRQDFDPDFATTYAVVGLQGLAPYWFEVDGAAYLSEDGDLTAGFEAEYELLLTQRLILQPRAELAFAAQDVPELGLGSGLTSAEAGARLRYEIDRQFAPYLGVSWHEKFGETADFARLEGEDTHSVSFVLGLRLWY